MQATPAPTPADIAALLAVEALQAHRVALQTLEKLMLHAAGALMNPTEEQKSENPAQARTATQRLRLVMQAARDILRFGGTGITPPSPGSAGEGARGSHRGRMRVPFDPLDTSSTAPHNNAAQEVNNLLAAAGRAFGSDERTKAGSESATQSVNPSSRVGEETFPPFPRDSSLIAHNSAAPNSAAAPPPDSALTTHDSPAPDPLPSSVPSASSVVNSLPPRDSSLVAHASSVPLRLTVVYPPPPPPVPLYGETEVRKVPPNFTDAEIDLFEATMRTSDPFPKPLYKHIVQWWSHCCRFNVKHPLPVTRDLLQERDPYRVARTAPSS